LARSARKGNADKGNPGMCGDKHRTGVFAPSTGRSADLGRQRVFLIGVAFLGLIAFGLAPPFGWQRTEWKTVAEVKENGVARPGRPDDQAEIRYRID
jgi:hypothetical protein